MGHAAWAFPPLAVVIGVLVLVRSKLVAPGPFRAGLWLIVPSLLLAFGAGFGHFGAGNPDAGDYSADVLASQGGFLGASLYHGTYSLFGSAGTAIVIILGLILGTLFLTGSSAQAITAYWARRVGRAAVVAGDASRQVASRAIEVGTGAARAAAEGAPFDGSSTFPDLWGDVPPSFARAVTDDGSSLEVNVESDETPTPAPARSRRRKRGQSGVVQPDQFALLEQLDTDLVDPAASSDAESNASAVDEVRSFDPESADTALPEVPAKSAAKKVVEAASDHVLKALVQDHYRLPEPTLLKLSKGSQEVKPGEVERIKKLLVETFGHFGLESKVVGMVPGPRVSRYELSLAPGTKMSKVENLRKDLSYALATTEIRILAPIPGKSAVGIEVENEKPSIVTLGDIYSPRPGDASPLHVWFGKDISGQVVGADLAKMPHLLVAGTTGAGKSGCMNAMLTSIVLGSSPDEIKMLLIDPKKVELSTYEGIPHLLTPVVTNMKKAANALGNVVAQMEERYASMEIAGARTLPEYNKIQIGRGNKPVPYMLIVIDELADLVMQAKSDVEDAVIRIAQKGRAAGFHLVVATQRPSVDVITGMIKSNVPSRIAFAVSSQTDSRVILDQNGAETLLGSGDMLFKPVWARTVHRVQGAWVSEAEVRSICDAARKQREPEYDIDLLRDPEPMPGTDSPDSVDQDDRIAEAIKLVAEYQTCSASFFQRRMRVGYTRGARLVDMLERRGICAPGEGPRPRSVLITMDDVPRYLSELGLETIGKADGAEAQQALALDE
jgi:S-DNA-T family DNA segregation ATPase FtsK/SpoIIIE